MPPATGLPRTWVGDTAVFWQLPAAVAFARLRSGPAGLRQADAERRRAQVGPNTAVRASRTDALSLLARQFQSPIILILAFATVISGLLGDVTDATIILAIMILSGLLGFWQERGATRAVAALLAMVRVTCEVLRDGRSVQVPLADVVPGDVVRLNAGDVVPGDCLVLDARALLVDEAALTGESYPAEKSPGVVEAQSPISQRSNALLMGTHLVSGTATVLVVHTGATTEFGALSAHLRLRPPPTSFERGTTAFGFLLMRAMVVLVAAIFVVNLVLARPLVDSALFSLALAVGLTPQLLPAIVTISLSQGARRMARKRVIVKRLDVIEDFGGMTVLCTDKTGTLTLGTVVLDAALGPNGQPSIEVGRLAYLNAHLQRGFSNPIDAAIVAAAPPDAPAAVLLDEIPYDFARKRLSVLVEDRGTPRMITKGALDNVLAVCTTARTPTGDTVELATILPDLLARYATRSQAGYRVLGVATGSPASRSRLRPADESDLTFEGFLTFLDPPKPGIAATLGELAAAGVAVRMITGDNRLVAAHVGGMAGLPVDRVMTGADLAGLSDAALAAVVADFAIFAEIDPAQKERIIRALRSSGQIVGFLGDGINDAPALHAADVGISVDTAVDVAKESAAIVLLDKDLRVILDGVREGRRTFANTMKYVMTTTSANFGNMLSMAAAAAVLPFLPLLADQILLINFLSDFPATAIATDDVDAEQLDRPHRWDIRYVRNFMIVFGITSSIFDLLTFTVLRIGFGADATLFRSGWFVESIATEIAVLFVLRTRRPFLRSRPSSLLVVASIAVAAVTVAIPYSPFAGALGLDAMPPVLPMTLAVITGLYILVTEIAKRTFNRFIDRQSGSAATVPGV